MLSAEENVTMSTLREQYISDGQPRIAMAAIHVCLLIIILIANFLAWIVIRMNDYYPRVTKSALIVLSITNIIWTSFVLPYKILFFIHGSWTFGRDVCVFAMITDFTGHGTILIIIWACVVEKQLLVLYESLRWSSYRWTSEGWIVVIIVLVFAIIITASSGTAYMTGVVPVMATSSHTWLCEYPASNGFAAFELIFKIILPLCVTCVGFVINHRMLLKTYREESGQTSKLNYRQEEESPDQRSEHNMDSDYESTAPSDLISPIASPRQNMRIDPEICKNNTELIINLPPAKTKMSPLPHLESKERGFLWTVKPAKMDNKNGYEETYPHQDPWPILSNQHKPHPDAALNDTLSTISASNLHSEMTKSDRQKSNSRLLTPCAPKRNSIFSWVPPSRKNKAHPKDVCAGGDSQISKDENAFMATHSSNEKSMDLSSNSFHGPAPGSTAMSHGDFSTSRASPGSQQQTKPLNTHRTILPPIKRPNSRLTFCIRSNSNQPESNDVITVRQIRSGDRDGDDNVVYDNLSGDKQEAMSKSYQMYWLDLCIKQLAIWLIISLPFSLTHIWISLCDNCVMSHDVIVILSSISYLGNMLCPLLVPILNKDVIIFTKFVKNTYFTRNRK